MTDLLEIGYDELRKKNCAILVSMYVNKKGTKVRQLLSCQFGWRAQVDFCCGGPSDHSKRI